MGLGLSGALSVVLILGAAAAMAQQQPAAPPLLKGVNGTESAPAATAVKAAAISAVKRKTVADMVNGGQVAMTGASSLAGRRT